MRKKPQVTLKCVANTHTDIDERIVEFSCARRGDGDDIRGGLISLRRMPDGTLNVCVYRTDPSVEVVVGHGTKWRFPLESPCVGPSPAGVDILDPARVRLLADALRHIPPSLLALALAEVGEQNPTPT